ncbi:farnesyl-diphosphate synthase [Malonomonas rubra DSM 5091]|uniref:Farnesyl-diphosphate synthase n=1 Tax=Malonomonas rubra DSM 5091 TaxID=1122189 RepID=A0A1M6BBE0_MALRU|nr:farnesyl diphosphate synthase [Malonomonas rubra]SHI46060.1 farnesyl-diphosphate synthase [Malonomonas rubra DSM 5091]
MKTDWQLETYLQDRIQLTESALDRYLPGADTLPAKLHEAMRYSVFAGGKRIRPVLMIAACETLGGNTQHVLPAACAIEMIHSYSLIHDDLPAMDDDDYRRGEPTNHKVFGEANAILAGDALLTEAFILLSNKSVWPEVDAEKRNTVISLLARSAGSRGMVGGQVVDMESEGKEIDLPTLEYIHTHKTGALILAAIKSGAIIGDADEDQWRALCRYGEAAGLAFQVADDILDIVADQSELGKDVGSDQERGKATYPALLGLEGARVRARELRDVALTALDIFGDKARPLREIAHYIVDRSF